MIEWIVKRKVNLNIRDARNKNILAYVNNSNQEK